MTFRRRSERDPGPSRRGRRQVSGGFRLLRVTAAVLLLSAQLAAAVHSHPGSLVQETGIAGQMKTETGICPLCLLAFHLPLSPASSPALADLQPEAAAAHAPAARSVPSFLRTSGLTRAPPATA